MMSKAHGFGTLPNFGPNPITTHPSSFALGILPPKSFTLHKIISLSFLGSQCENSPPFASHDLGS